MSIRTEHRRGILCTPQGAKSRGLLEANETFCNTAGAPHPRSARVHQTERRGDRRGIHTGSYRRGRNTPPAGGSASGFQHQPGGCRAGSQARPLPVGLRPDPGRVGHGRRGRCLDLVAWKPGRPSRLPVLRLVGGHRPAGRTSTAGGAGQPGRRAAGRTGPGLGQRPGGNPSLALDRLDLRQRPGGGILLASAATDPHGPARPGRADRRPGALEPPAPLPGAHHRHLRQPRLPGRMAGGGLAPGPVVASDDPTSGGAMGRPGGLDPGRRRHDPDLDPSRLGGRRSGRRRLAGLGAGGPAAPRTDPDPEPPDRRRSPAGPAAGRGGHLAGGKSRPLHGGRPPAELPGLSGPQLPNPSLLLEIRPDHAG